jgi:NAD(P)-dependent dehydrogenase (short-subunit alcohol dehydrogenase family)
MATVVITGANRGIGLALAELYTGRGDRVVGTAREPSEAWELAATGARVEPLEVTDPASVAALAAALDGEAVDLVVANAGILVDDTRADLDPQTVLRQLAVNAVGPLAVALALSPHLALAARPKLVALTSYLGSIGENRDGGYYGYRASKAALNALFRGLAVDLAPLPVLLLHPGYVRTRMTEDRGEITPEEAAADLAALIDRAGPRHSGRFLDRHGKEIPW